MNSGRKRCRSPRSYTPRRGRKHRPSGCIAIPVGRAVYAPSIVGSRCVRTDRQVQARTLGPRPSTAARARSPSSERPRSDHAPARPSGTVRWHNRRGAAKTRPTSSWRPHALESQQSRRAWLLGEPYRVLSTFLESSSLKNGNYTARHLRNRCMPCAAGLRSSHGCRPRHLPPGRHCRQ